MSYCVNCGVHLNDQARSCPLCGIRVVNPATPSEMQTKPPTKLKEEKYHSSFDKNLWIKLITITLISPAIISVLVNWILQQQISWSLFVTASLTFVWIWSISPFFFKRNRLLKWIPFGAASLLGFLYIIEQLSKTNGWFSTLALPITISFFTLLAALTILIKNKILKELQIPASVFISIGVFCVCINSAISFHNSKTLIPDWSLIVLITCIAFASIAFVLQQRPWIVEELKHWFRI